jgi:hypothetical protein
LADKVSSNTWILQQAWGEKTSAHKILDRKPTEKKTWQK